jgi:alkanesulfonate monooxygenase SsuD/methylene tetrahydromethanopterin reductase-like flavin-dependent oxidoreductase (luciferase family)
MTDLRFGFQLTPTTDLARHRDLVAVAEENGLDLVGVQDHPYVASHVDAMALIGDLLARTERLRFFPDVVSLPLRPPATLAKTAATLDLLSGGRFELGLGAGGYWPGITSLGVAEQSPADALDALAEAIGLMRALWQDGTPRVTAEGRYFSANVKAGPAPAHPVEVWVGSIGTRSQQLTGRLADGWAAPIPSYLPYEKWAPANATIDRAAREAGRDPAEVRRIAQITGTVTETRGDIDTSRGAEPFRGTPDQWASYFARLASEQPFRTFVLWPEEHTAEQIERFATQVVPATRALLGAEAAAPGR